MNRRGDTGAYGWQIRAGMSWEQDMKRDSLDAEIKARVPLWLKKALAGDCMAQECPAAYGHLIPAGARPQRRASG